MGKIQKLDHVPKHLAGVNGFLVTYVEKPRFFAPFDEQNVKKEWFDKTALSYTLQEDPCIKVLTAERMRTTEYEQMYNDITLNYWSGSYERKG